MEINSTNNAGDEGSHVMKLSVGGEATNKDSTVPVVVVEEVPGGVDTQEEQD